MSEKSSNFAPGMTKEIPNMIMKDAKARGFSSVRYAGEFDGLDYFHYVNDNTAHYSGLPAIVKVVNGKIEDVTELSERLRAYNFVLDLLK